MGIKEINQNNLGITNKEFIEIFLERPSNDFDVEIMKDVH